MMMMMRGKICFLKKVKVHSECNHTAMYKKKKEVNLSNLLIYNFIQVVTHIILRNCNSEIVE